MNQSPNHITDTNLIRYLLKETSPEENLEIEEWISADPENRDYFQQFETIWQQSAVLVTNSKVDEDAAWNRFRTRAFQNSSRNRKPLWASGWIRVAALIILLTGIAWIGFQIFTPGKAGENLVAQATSQPARQLLADGSVITLNKNSSLSYPKSFAGNSRKVQLKGEAFFDIAPDRSRPFTIDVNEIEVRVVGTSFNIRSDSSATEVVVESGIVEVRNGSGKTITLKPGEKIQIRKNSPELITQKETDQLYKYYRTREFVCDQTPLWKLVEVLNEAYQVNIEIGNPALRSQLLTTTFSDESLDHILEVVSLTFDIKIDRQPGKIILR